MTTVKVRQNSMRDIACSGSVFAYSTLATNGGRVKKYAKACQSALTKKNHLVMPAMTNYH
jgi:hypothetical protein